MRAFEIEREPGSWRFTCDSDSIVYADCAIDGVELVAAIPLGARRTHMQGQIGFRRAVDAHG